MALSFITSKSREEPRTHSDATAPSFKSCIYLYKVRRVGNRGKQYVYWQLLNSYSRGGFDIRYVFTLSGE